MPIPSVTSSSSFSSGTEENKCKQTIPPLKSLNGNASIIEDAMETDVANENQQEGFKKKINKPLYARRNDNEKTVNISEERIRPDSKSSLYSGSRFHGFQKCGSQSYEVDVELLNVDIKNSTLCGYLKIKGLTTEFPELTTFFQAEIIGDKYSFHTKKWHADRDIDLLHWRRFPSFKPYIESFHTEYCTHNIIDDDDHIYMRWKETFLVPNHRVNSIHGASYAGFYYVCFQSSTNTIKGFYFYRLHKDWFQELDLKHIPDNGFAHFEFR